MGHPNPVEASLPAPPPRVGDYLLLDEIGRGGSGVVYGARQQSTDRVVALKLLSKLRFASPRERARFRAEAGMASRLDHPGIVPVFEFGEIDGQPFYTMALIEGGNLDERIEGGPLEPPAAVALLLELCGALEHAHGRDIVHRDLKPANILFDESGHARIADFGLAKDIGSQRDLTQTGELLGTPSYMAPEQISGGGELDARVDVYALGCVLYASLTGRPPFRAASMMGTLQQVLEAVPVPTRLANPAVPRGLDAICMRCLEKRADDRYPSARALADDLTAFLEGRPVRADDGRTHAFLRLLSQESRYTDVMARWSGIGMVHAAMALALFAGTGLLALLGVPSAWIFGALWLPGGLAATVVPVVLRQRHGAWTQIELQLAKVWCLFGLAVLVTILCQLAAGAPLQELVPLVLAEAALTIGCMSVLLQGSFYSLAGAYALFALAAALTPPWAIAPLGVAASALHLSIAWRARPRTPEWVEAS